VIQKLKGLYSKLKSKLKISDIDIVFVAVTAIGIISVLFALYIQIEDPEAKAAKILHYIFGGLYSVVGGVFLFMIRKKRWWNLLPAIVGIATAIFSLCFVSESIGGNPYQLFFPLVYISMPICMLFYSPLLLYVIEVLTSGYHLLASIIMTVLGVLLAVYGIRNIVNNKPGNQDETHDNTPKETVRTTD